jgi:hypothetical protein
MIMASKTQKTARVGLFTDLKDLQDSLKDIWADMSIPDDWDYLEKNFPARKKKIKVTLYLDEDMLRWFRKLGKGYHARINAILRIYWRGLISGDVRSYQDAHEVAPNKIAYLAGMRTQFEHDLKIMEEQGKVDAQTAEQLRHATGSMWSEDRARREILRRVLRQRMKGGKLEG